MTKFYSKTLSYWLPNHCQSFPDRADFQDVSTMLPRLHEPTMPMSTIFQIVEIRTARSAQCDLGFNHHQNEAICHRHKFVLQLVSWGHIGLLDCSVVATCTTRSSTAIILKPPHKGLWNSLECKLAHAKLVKWGWLLSQMCLGESMCGKGLLYWYSLHNYIWFSITERCVRVPYN